MNRTRRDNRIRRRGTAAVAILVVLLLCGLFVVGIVNVGARDQNLSVSRLETVQAFYAAEAGVQMAYREISIGLDEDGDGSIGTISSDGNGADDPTIGLAAVHVGLETDQAVVILTSVGRAGLARRKIESSFEH